MRKFILAFLVVVLIVMLGVTYVLKQFQQTADLSYSKLQSVQSTVVYDKNDRKIDELYKTVPRQNVSSNEIPDYVKMAFVATEDRRFYKHFGIDLQGIGRALFKNIVTMSKAEGASTITQQLARNLYLSSDKTIKRKVDEMFLSLGLERQFTKDQILELYLNQIYFGSGVYGIGAASQIYFNKPVSDLTVGEAALLAGLPKAPSTYSPSNSTEKATARRNVVLKLMHDQNVISDTQYQQALNERVVEPSIPVKKPNSNQAFIDYVIKEAAQQYGVSADDLYKGGYAIYTDLDPNLQESINNSVANHTFRDDAINSKVEVGISAVNPKTGGISAMYGGRSYERNGLNRATSGYQLGSAIKPLAVYGPALETGDYTPTSLLSDERQDFGGGYSPKNAEGEYQKHVTMREALTRSLNVPAVWLLKQIGIDTSAKFMEKAGLPLEDDDKSKLGLALGGTTTTFSPLQLAQGYTTFANKGVMTKPYAIRKIEMRDGEVKKPDIQTERVMSEDNADTMTSMLQDVIEKSHGTGINARSSRDAAGKTGTTNDVKDAWFVGYTDDAVVSIHAGFDNANSTQTTKYLSGGGGQDPATLFSSIMNNW
ncbi:transglycosylase domain-containing protein [Priestia aryabhattai]|uniref:transglycosylase domain-containing protein n=1 Tax=Priestia megaterium TaxID=1404 RepID=UPI003F9796E6